MNQNNLFKPKSYDYLDYRVFFKDRFSWKQKESKGFTQRQLSQDAQIALGLFTKIVKGERDLSAKVMIKLADSFALDEKEYNDLELLVLYNQAKTQSEKLARLKDLMELRSGHTHPTTLDKKHYQFYTEWHHSAIREVISSGAFCGTFKELGQLLIPSISSKEAKESIQLLTDLNLVEEVESKGGSYIWKVLSQLITSDEELAKTSVRKFNQDMIDKGKEALDQFTKEQRNISTVTLSLHESQYPLLVDKLRQFRKEILAMAAADNQSNKVLQLNMQLFPLSQKIKSRGEV